MIDKEKNKTIVIFFFIIKWQTSLANVMASLKSLLINKLPRSESTELVALVFVKTGTFGAKKLLGDFRGCHILFCWRFFSFEKKMANTQSL